MIFAGISNEPWPIPSAWRASTTTWLGLLRMRLASSRAGTPSPMRPNRIGRGGPPVLGMADWPTQTRLRRLLIRSRVSGGTTPAGAVAKFWRLPRVEHAGAICASEPEVADDPDHPCREAEAPVDGRFQGPPLRSDADPAG